MGDYVLGCWAFDKDIAWTTEFGELVMVWTTFLGVAAAVQPLLNNKRAPNRRRAEIKNALVSVWPCPLALPSRARGHVR